MTAQPHAAELRDRDLNAVVFAHRQYCNLMGERTPWCTSCGLRWPCLTVQAIAELRAARTRLAELADALEQAQTTVAVLEEGLSGANYVIEKLRTERDAARTAGQASAAQWDDA